MELENCIYPNCQIKIENNCQIKIENNSYCEHSCEWEKSIKKSIPYSKKCTANLIPGGICQFPHCDC